MNKIMVSLLALWICSACAINLPSFLKPGPQVINHPMPQLKVDISPFENAGCVKDSYWRCSEESPLKKMGCDFLEDPGSLVGGLSPLYPVVECRTRITSHPETTQGYLYWDGCLIGDLVRLLVYKDGKFELIGTAEEMQAAFAPVDSQNEALSFTLASTNYEAQFGLKAEPGYRYSVKTLEDTHVVETESGYRVNLYEKRFCGCGPHTTFMRDILVTRDGKMEISDPQPIFENPKEDGLCID
jgi:hypothetical protein